MVGHCDVVTINCPLHPETEHLFVAEDDDPGEHTQPLMQCPGCRAFAAAITGLSTDMRVVTLQCGTCGRQFWEPFPPTPRHISD